MATSAPVRRQSATRPDPPADASAGSCFGSRDLLPLLAADPEQLGPVRILCRLPPGGQGCDVFLGELRSCDGRRGPVMVVKRLPAECDRPTRRLFAREIAVASLIRSERVPAVVHVDLGVAAPYYVQAFAPGAPLSELLQQRGGRLGAEETRTIAVEVLRALVDLDDCGVVHGDVKPGNLVVSGTRVWLVDLGLGRLIGSDDTGPLAQRGTKHYASPEHFRIDGTLGPASDLFAWGLVVARTAAGRHPVDPTLLLDDRDYYRALTAGAPDLWPLTGALRAAVSRALSPDPADRGTARQLLDQLECHSVPAPTAGG